MHSPRVDLREDCRLHGVVVAAQRCAAAELEAVAPERQVAHGGAPLVHGRRCRREPAEVRAVRESQWYARKRTRGCSRGGAFEEPSGDGGSGRVHGGAGERVDVRLGTAQRFKSSMGGHGEWAC